jgi:HD-GYP domain-containing protein (c-di-GMP phosphodiesterase class II)
MEEARAMSREKPDLLWVRMDGAVAEGAEGAVSFVEEPFPPRDPGDLYRSRELHQAPRHPLPLLLRPVDGKLQVVCGYRRFLAARAAGLVEIPALITELGDAEAIRSYLSENAIRRSIDSRAEEEAIQLLKSLRDRSRTIADGQTVEPEALPIERQIRLESVASAMRAAARTRYFSEDEGSEQEEGDVERSRPRPSPEDFAWRLLERMESFLGDVLRERKVDVRKANSITDVLLEVIDLGPLDWRPLARGGEGDITAVHFAPSRRPCARTASVLDWNEEDSRTLVLGGVLHDVEWSSSRSRASAPRGLPSSPPSAASSKGIRRIGCAWLPARDARAPGGLARHAGPPRAMERHGLPGGKRADVEIYPRLPRSPGHVRGHHAKRPYRDALSPGVAFERLSKAFELGLYDPALCRSSPGTACREGVTVPGRVPPSRRLPHGLREEFC